jgi:hypothetical protein
MVKAMGPIFSSSRPLASLTKAQLRYGQTKRFYWTVSVVDPVIPPELAPMVVVPAAMQFAWPPTLGAFAMVATVACDELQ